MSLSCALLATSLHQWARRYLRLAQPARCSPEKRARMRAFFANGVEKMHVPWAVEGLPTLLHISLFLFFGGLVIFLFHVDHEVVSYVIWWIGLFSMVYGLITLLPIIRHDSPYNSPLSTPAWFLYASMHYVTFKILSFIPLRRFRSILTWKRFQNSRDLYQGWTLGGVEKAADETASERSSEIDVQILDWTISALGDDDSLKSFLEAIPGFFNSKLVKHLDGDFPEERQQKFSDALCGFLGRTWSSNSIDDSEKLRRLDISIKAMNQIGVSHIWSILNNIYFEHWDEVPQTLEMAHTLAPWCTNSDQSVAEFAQATVARILGGMRERHDSWITLAARISGLPEHDLRDNITHGIDNVQLAILIQLIRPTTHSTGILQILSELDIRNTLPRLQNDFCVAWNKLVQEGRNQGSHCTPVTILMIVGHLYVALHQDTDAAPTAFSAFIRDHDRILYKPSSYPLCNLTSHRPVSITQIPVSNSCEVPLPTPPGNSPDALFSSPADGSSTVPLQARQTNIIARLPAPSNPTTTSEIGETPQGPDTTPLTNPAHSSPYPTDDSPTGSVAASTQNVTLTATLLKSCDSSAVSASNSSLTATVTSVVGFSDPVSPPPPHVLSSPSTEFIAPLRSTTPSYPTNDATLPYLARGLANSGNMCSANAVLQILVRSPPFWNLLKELGSLKGQRGGVPETDGVVVPLVDTTTRFMEEFLVEKESPPIQQTPRQVAGERWREDEEKKGHNTLDPFDPTYMYDAMKEKRQLKDFLVRFWVT